MQGTPETKNFQSERRRVLVNRSSCPAIRPQSIPSFEIPKRPKSTERLTWSQGAYQRRRTESLTLSSTDWRVFRSELRRSNTISSSDLTGLDFSDPGYGLSLSLKHAPHAKTSYGFPRIVISPTTTRKESIFHDTSRSKQQHHQLGTKNQSSSVERDQEAWHYLSRPRCDSGMSDGSDFSIPTTPKSRTSTFSSISENETSPQKESKCQQLPTRLQRKFSCFNEDTHIEDWGYSSESSTPEGGSPKPTHRRFSVDPIVRGTRQRMSHHAVEDTVRQELLKQLHALCVKQNANSHRDLGEIEYWLKYDFARQTLKVLILRAENVGTTSSAERVNTYARVTLMTDSSITQQTRVIKHTRDPIYDQEITFPLEPVDVHIASLQIRVFRQRKFTNVLGGPVFLGMVNNTTLSHLLVSPTKRLREDLHAEEQMEKDPTRMNLSVCYKPKRKVLEVTVVKVGDLPRSSFIGLPDTEVRVKVTQISDGEVRTKSFRTKTKRWNANPVFKEAFSFPVTNVQNLRDGLSVTCTVVCQDHLRKHKSFGQIGLGLSATQESEQQHWKEVLGNPGFPCNKWHNLVEGKISP